MVLTLVLPLSCWDLGCNTSLHRSLIWNYVSDFVFQRFQVWMSHVHLAESPAWIVWLSFRTELINFAVLLLGQEVSRCYWLSEVTVVESDWPAPSVQHRQFVQPSSRPFLSRNSVVQSSFSSFEQLAKAQASWLFEKKKICNVYWSADQECHSSNRSPCSQLPPLLQDEWMEASGINMATRPIKNRHDWKMASAKKTPFIWDKFLAFLCPSVANRLPGPFLSRR